MNPGSPNPGLPCPPCPVCQSRDSGQMDEFPVADLCVLFQKQLGVDVTREFPSGLTRIVLHRCANCGLEFVDPPVAGSPEFYAHLSSEAAYYSETRWEFEPAKALLASVNSVLDVGCGDGFFLSLLPHTNKRGLEFNPKAAAVAQRRGLDVRQDRLADLDASSFDAVTLFHVL